MNSDSDTPKRYRGFFFQIDDRKMCNIDYNKLKIKYMIEAHLIYNHEQAVVYFIDDKTVAAAQEVLENCGVSGISRLTPLSKQPLKEAIKKIMKRTDASAIIERGKLRISYSK